MKNANDEVVSPRIEGLTGPLPPEDCGGALAYSKYMKA